jgi:hypothetical protein
MVLYVRKLFVENFTGSEKITQHSWKTFDFIKVLKNDERKKSTENEFNSIKSSSASATASILDEDHWQAFVTVSLSRMPNSSMILCTRELAMFWGALLTWNSGMTHTLKSGGYSQASWEGEIRCYASSWLFLLQCFRCKVCWHWMLCFILTAAPLVLLAGFLLFTHLQTQGIFGLESNQIQCSNAEQRLRSFSKNSCRTLYIVCFFQRKCSIRSLVFRSFILSRNLSHLKKD